MEIHQRVSDCWKNSLKNGKMEFALLSYFAEPEEDTIQLTYEYDSPILWQRYGTEGTVMEADTYTFFPFYKEYEKWAVISKGRDYTTEAFIVSFCSDEELKETIYTIFLDFSST